MHTLSQPPSDRTDGPESSTTKTYPHNKELRAQLLALRASAPEWSNNAIAKKTRVNSSYVSRYLDAAGCRLPESYSAGAERKFTAFLRNLSLKRASGVETVESNVSELIAKRLGYIRSTNDIGLVIDNSGEGKTCALELHLKKNEGDVLLRVCQWRRNVGAVANMLFAVASKDGYDNRTGRMEWAAKKFAGSETLIIIDDAHKLTMCALLSLMEFNDETGCPIALVGTRELLAKVKLDPQMLSRVGIGSPLTSKLDRNLIEHHLKTFIPAANGETEILLTLCEQIASHAGGPRAVRKTLRLAVKLKEDSKEFTSYEEAVRAAHLLLVRDYKLS